MRRRWASRTLNCSCGEQATEEHVMRQVPSHYRNPMGATLAALADSYPSVVIIRGRAHFRDMRERDL